MTVAQPQANSKRDDWYEQYRRWQASGLSVAAYCRQNELRTPSLYYWKKVFERPATAISSSPAQPGSAFIPVSALSPAPGALTLTVGDAALSLPRDLTEAELTAWVRALRAA